MNLAYPITDTAEIEGVTYDLDMSFDNILRLFDLIRDESIADDIKVHTGLLMLIDDDLMQYDIETKAQIFIDLFKNAIGADEEKHQAVDLAGNPMPKMTDEDKKTHDLVQDAEYIYASFMHTYRIDLFELQGKLQWKKLKAPMTGLDEASIFSRVVGMREAISPTGKGTAKARERLCKLKCKYSLKEYDTLEKNE